MRTTFIALMASMVWAAAAGYGSAESIYSGAAAAGPIGGDGYPTFGPAVSAPDPVLPGGSYAGWTSTVTSGPSGILGSTATILDGIDPSGAAATTPSMSWRTRADGEIAATHTSPPMLPGFAHVLSDVVQLDDVQGLYVLQMNYSAALEAGDEATDVQNGFLYLATLQPQTPGGANYWVNAAANYWSSATEGANAVQNYLGSYATFLDGRSLTDTMLGTWGVDTNSKTVWAVLNYSDHQFAAVPEPASMTLLAAAMAVAGVPLTMRWRRRRAG